MKRLLQSCSINKHYDYFSFKSLIKIRISIASYLSASEEMHSRRTVTAKLSIQFRVENNHFANERLKKITWFSLLSFSYPEQKQCRFPLGLKCNQQPLTLLPENLLCGQQCIVTKIITCMLKPFWKCMWKEDKVSSMQELKQQKKELE